MVREKNSSQKLFIQFLRRMTCTFFTCVVGAQSSTYLYHRPQQAATECVCSAAEAHLILGLVSPMSRGGGGFELLNLPCLLTPGLAWPLADGAGRTPLWLSPIHLWLSTIRRERVCFWACCSGQEPFFFWPGCRVSPREAILFFFLVPAKIHAPSIMAALFTAMKKVYTQNTYLNYLVIRVTIA